MYKVMSLQIYRRRFLVFVAGGRDEKPLKSLRGGQTVT